MRWMKEKYHYDVSPYPYFALYLRFCYYQVNYKL